MSRFRCVECGGMFTTNVHTARYCSDECRHAKQRKKQKKWRSENPDYMKNYMRKYRKKDNATSEDELEKNGKRKCVTCGVVKVLSTENFAKHKHRKSGFNNKCKECQRIADMERYKRNRGKILEQKKEYYQRNKEEIKARQLKYHHSKKSSL